MQTSPTATHLLPGDKGLDALRALLGTLDTPQARHLKSMRPSRLVLPHYHKVMTEERTDLPYGPAPDLLTCSLEDLHAWLFLVWQTTEYTQQAPGRCALPFTEWLVRDASDVFYHTNVHARFFLEHTQPALILSPTED